MKTFGSRSPVFWIGAVLIVAALIGGSVWLVYFLRSKPPQTTSSKYRDSIANNHAIPNPGGEAATFSTQGSVTLTGEYFKVPGKNGQSCASCHIPEDAWSISATRLQQLFDETDGTHPVFSQLDSNNPNMDVSSAQARRAAYSMLLTRGVFRRGGEPRPNSEWELIAADDPHGYADLTRLVHWRRSMPTINFPVGGLVVNWDAKSNVGKGQRAALVNLTKRLATGALQGPPASDEFVADIVDFQTALFTAQVTVPGVGRLDADGAKGGPQLLSTMSPAQGEFNLFDAWTDDVNPKRAQIARGQKVFNSMNVSHKSCIACHDSVNNGTSAGNTLFDVNTASEAARTPDLPLYTFRNKATGEIRKLTDAGFGNVSGRWEDLGLFKTPTLRALAARAPYFHNGIAATLEEVVRHYEKHFGFVFTDEERADLVAFLNAL